MIRRAPILLAAVLVLAGCGGSGPGTEGATATLAVFFLRDGQVWPVPRKVDLADDSARAALEQLEAGPTDDEADSLDAETALEEGDIDLESLVVAGGVAQLATSGDLTPEARAQVVYTLSRAPEVESVQLDGELVAPADYEEQTPLVLVESPLAFEDVRSPLTAAGTANTFEATFSFEILDSSGEVIAADFVTATSGTGMRGTFEFSQPFVVDSDQEGTLRVFELSAEDGSRINEVETPVELRE